MAKRRKTTKTAVAAVRQSARKVAKRAAAGATEAAETGQGLFGQLLSTLKEGYEHGKQLATSTKLPGKRTKRVKRGKKVAARKPAKKNPAKKTTAKRKKKAKR